MNENNVVKEIRLDNDLLLTITDCSKKVGKDAWFVSMTACIRIPVDKKHFPDSSKGGIPYEDAAAKLGGEVLFEHKAERNFIMEPDREKVFSSLVEDFMSTSLAYLSRPEFATKFIEKKYRDLAGAKRLKRF